MRTAAVVATAPTELTIIVARRARLMTVVGDELFVHGLERTRPRRSSPQRRFSI
jgi:hypothetical protein